MDIVAKTFREGMAPKDKAINRLWENIPWYLDTYFVEKEQIRLYATVGAFLLMKEHVSEETIQLNKIFAMDSKLQISCPHFIRNDFNKIKQSKYWTSEFDVLVASS